jgi:hypothetical protein
MTETSRQTSGEPRSRWAITTLAIVAAFGTYFCMYAFRKPFTAASYANSTLWGIDFKTLLVCAQVFGYMVSKFVGIRIVAEMKPTHRAWGILSLVLIAEVALVLFGIIPRPWNLFCLFLNGLPLGMVFGLVLGYLEGRRETEALTAGLCASFILAGGVTKSLGAWLLKWNVSEYWMPAVAGAFFLLPLLIFVVMLSRVPVPSEADIQARAKREPLDKAGRKALASRYFFGLILIVITYTLVTVLRSIRDDFGPELFKGLGEPASPSAFAMSDLFVTITILAISAGSIFIRNNRKAFFVSLVWCLIGFNILAATILASWSGLISAFSFMVFVGLSLYIPYVMIHTTVFERLLAATRDAGNIGFLMYLADAFGYLGYVGVMLGFGMRSNPNNAQLVSFFMIMSLCVAIVSFVLISLTIYYFSRKIPPGENHHA